MGATARATRRTRRSARGDDDARTDEEEIARDVARDDGCKTPERRAKTTDEDVRVDAKSSFPAQIDVMVLSRRRARETRDARAARDAEETDKNHASIGSRRRSPRCSGRPDSLIFAHPV